MKWTYSLVLLLNNSVCEFEHIRPYTVPTVTSILEFISDAHDYVAWCNELLAPTNSSYVLEKIALSEFNASTSTMDTAIIYDRSESQPK